MTTALPPLPPGSQALRWLGPVALVWFGAVTLLSVTGQLGRIPLPWFAGLVALGIAAPVVAYFASTRIRAGIRALGLYPLTLMHAWRVPAAVLFFAYGLTGALPPLFWLLAGTGDLIAGLMAWSLRGVPDDRKRYWRFHAFGFADFVVAVGTGLTFTLLGDSRMQILAELPMAWIPLFGVAISGASHIIAFDMLRHPGPQPATTASGT